jgi:hypothetical protein
LARISWGGRFDLANYVASLTSCSKLLLTWLGNEKENRLDAFDGENVVGAFLITQILERRWMSSVKCHRLGQRQVPFGVQGDTYDSLVQIETVVSSIADGRGVYAEKRVGQRIHLRRGSAVGILILLSNG